MVLGPRPMYPDTAMDKYVARAFEFVVSAGQIAELAALAEAAPPNVHVEPLPGDRDRCLVKVAHTPDSAARNWAVLRRRLGSAYRVLPVLADTSGRRLYPTGRVQVRFKRRVPDTTLTKFARRHGLKLLSRNEFQPEQAVFEPYNEERFLMDVVDSASHDDDVRLAWPETKSQFTKA